MLISLSTNGTPTNTIQGTKHIVRMAVRKKSGSGCKLGPNT